MCLSFCQYDTVLITIAVLLLKSGRLNSPCFFKIVSAILEPLAFRRTFKIILSTYTNVLVVILIRIV